MFKKIVFLSMILSLSLGNLAVMAPRAHATTLQEALQALADKVQQAKTENAQNSTEAAAEREAKRLENAKKLVKAVIEGARKWVDTQESRLNNNKRMDDDDRSTIQALFDDTRTWLDSVEDDIDAAESVDEVKELASQARSEWKERQAEVKIAYVDIWIEGGHEAIERYENVSVFLEDVVSKLKESDKDTSTLEGLIDNLNAEVEESITLLEEAIEHLETLKTVTGKDAIKEFLNAASLVMQAIGNLQSDALAALQDALKEVKNLFSQS